MAAMIELEDALDSLNAGRRDRRYASLEIKRFSITANGYSG
jgi:hypothetical protein